MEMKKIFSDEIIQDLAKSGILPEEASKVGWFSVSNPTGDKLKELLGFTLKDMSAISHILVFPYYNRDREIIYNRVKLYPPINDMKYLQPKNTSTCPYIIPGLWKIKDKPNHPLIITEGEKKALCLYLNDFNAIALPGVWNFGNKNRENPDLTGMLKDWVWKGRDVRICFDSDFIFNPSVRKACIELSLMLWIKGAVVRIIQLPQLNHKEKVGVDDYIKKEGINAFRELNNKALSIEKTFPSSYFEEVLKSISKLNIQKQKISLLIELLHNTWKIPKKELFNYLSSLRKEEKKTPIYTEEERQEALKILKNEPNILEKMVELTERYGHIGEVIGKKLLYISGISLKTDEGISIYLKASSSVGKNVLADSITKLFPPNVYKKLSDISEKALYHLEDNDLSHKLLYIAEVQGTEQANHPLRLILSEKELVYSYPLKNPQTGEFKTIEKRICAVGTAQWTATTKARMSNENQTRAFDLYLNETGEQTRRILQAQAKVGLWKELSNEELEKEARIWQALYTCVDPLPVSIPYAKYLADVFPIDKVRVRRDFPRFISLIKASALLYQYQRERKEIKGKTCIVANIQDYAVAYEIGKEVLRQSLQELSPREEEILGVINDKFDKEEFSNRELEPLISLGTESVKKYINTLTKINFLEWNGEKGKNSKHWLIKTPDEGIKLPSPEEVKKFPYIPLTPLPLCPKTQDVEGTDKGNAQNTLIYPNTPIEIEESADIRVKGNTRVKTQLPLSTPTSVIELDDKGNKVMEIQCKKSQEEEKEIYQFGYKS